MSHHKIKQHQRLLVLVGVLIIVFVIFIFNQSSTGTVGSTKSNAQTNTQSNTSVTVVPHTVAQTATPTPVQGYVVTYTNTGFSPNNIQVPKGKAVKFVNNSDTPLSIVADNQNSTLLNQINQPKPVTKGGVYTFDFVYVGVWAFHNSNKPSDHGNIVVY